MLLWFLSLFLNTGIEVSALHGHHEDKAGYKAGAPGAGLVPPCSTCSGTASAPREKAPVRPEICTWKVSPRVSASPEPCRLPALPAIVFLKVCGELFAAGLIHSPQDQIGLGSDPVRGLCCVSAHGNTKEQSPVICSVISSFVP